MEIKLYILVVYLLTKLGNDSEEAIYSTSISIYL